jgi:hypothetical protein
MRRFVTALVLVVVTSVSALAQALPVPSYWLNQRGSEMKLFDIDPLGVFRGAPRALPVKTRHSPSTDA